jgi:hypothetical protein
VFSSDTSFVTGSWPERGSVITARICSGASRPANPGSGRVNNPECTAGPPCSAIKTCECSSAITTSPGSVRIFSAIWFDIVAVGR